MDCGALLLPAPLKGILCVLLVEEQGAQKTRQVWTGCNARCHQARVVVNNKRSGHAMQSPTCGRSSVAHGAHSVGLAFGHYIFFAVGQYVSSNTEHTSATAVSRVARVQPMYKLSPPRSVPKRKGFNSRKANQRFLTTNTALHSLIRSAESGGRRSVSSTLCLVRDPGQMTVRLHKWRDIR